MSRFAVAISVSMCAVILGSTLEANEPPRKSGATSDTLQLGKSMGGELEGPKLLVSYPGGGDNMHQAKVLVSLRAGQSISISANVTGQGRRISLGLLDPKSANLGATAPSVKTATFKLDEVPSTGKYTILINSDLTGPFTLRADGDADTAVAPASNPDLAALEKRVKQLELEVVALKSELELLKKKVKTQR